MTLTSTGIVTWDNALPNRAVEQSRLPLSGITYGAEVTPAQFLAQMRPLFEWSKRENCRFFVRVKDATNAIEKEIYKRHLRTVGDRFYYFEPR